MAKPAGEQEDTTNVEIPETNVDIKPPEGYSVEEWEGLTDEERDAIMEGIEEETNETDENEETNTKLLEEIAASGKTPEELAEEATAKIAAAAEAAGKTVEELTAEATAAGKTIEEFIAELAPVEKTAEQLAAEATAAGKTAEQLEAEKATPPATTGSDITDEQLLSFKPVINEADIKVDKPPVPDEVKQQLAALKTKFEDGEMDRDAYDEARDEINRELATNQALFIMERKQAIRDDLMWSQEQKEFFKAKPYYVERLKDTQGNEVTVKDAQGNSTPVFTQKSVALFGAFGTVVKQLGNRYDHMKLLIEADKVITETFGLKAAPVKATAATATTSAAATEKDKKAAITEKPARKTDDLITLGDVSTAGKNPTDDGWGAADKLTGHALEEWLSKQPDAVRDAYIDSLEKRRGG
jgi:hypothetical protein